MKFRLNYCLLLIAIFACSAVGSAQGFQIEGKAPSSLSSLGAQTFTSIEARFTIALPQMISSFQPLSYDAPTGRMLGSTYVWNLSEGQFSCSFIDRTDIENKPEAYSILISKYRENILAQLSKGAGKVLNDNSISLASYQGHQIKAEVNGGLLINRVYFVEKRMYLVIVLMPPHQRSQEAIAMKSLDSFKLFSQSEIQAVIRKMVEDSTPAPLPQEPVAKKLKSDAEDDALKGKVKIIADDTEDLSGTWSVSGRKPSSVAYYNERGNLTKRESYDYKGNPMEIVVYGFIDGDKVTNSKMLRYEYDPPPMMMPPPAAGQAQSKPDARYDTKYKYIYDGKGNLLEKELYRNTGKLSIRYVYSYKDKQRERKVYSDDGSLNQKYMEVVDDKGNVAEMTDFDVRSGAIRNQYSYAYEYDAKGNWIKKTTAKLVTKDGKSNFEPAYVTYRTITYY